MLPDIKKATTQCSQYKFLNQKNRQIDNYICSNQQAEYQDILLNEKDERFRYLLSHGTLMKIENHGNIIFAELPQITGVWICYRRPADRELNPEKLNLDSKDLT